MRRDLLNSLIGVIVLTIVLGLAYPLAFTGVAQVLFPARPRLEDHRERPGRRLEPDRPELPGTEARAYFHPRPSADRLRPLGHLLRNIGPNSRAAKQEVQTNLADYLQLEGPTTRG